MYWDVLEIHAIAPRTLEVLFSDGLRGTIFIDASFCIGVFEVLKEDSIISQAFVEITHNQEGVILGHVFFCFHLQI